MSWWYWIFVSSTDPSQLTNPAEGLDIKENEESCYSSAWASMGKITPLHDLDYRAVEPSRIYKFNPKYFLTMGGWTRCSADAGQTLLS